MPKVNVGMDLAVTLPNFKQEFETNIIKEINTVIKLRMPSIIANIESEVALLITQLIKASPVYQSLISRGVLAGELGLPNTDLIEDIIDVWVDGIVVAYEESAELGDIIIEAIDSDYSDVLASPSAFFISENGYQIDWLQWLLLRGSRVIIPKYRFLKSRQGLGSGRTGLGIMIAGKRSWRIPDGFSGTAESNFVTRALRGIRPRINNIVEKQILQGLR